MNATQENKISMYMKLRTFYTNNLGSFVISAPALDDKVSTFNALLIGLGNYEMMASDDNSGHAIQKQVNRTAMRDLAITVAGALKGLAVDTNNYDMLRKASITRSDIDKGRDTDALYLCNQLGKLATANSAAIIPFGITATKLTAYIASVTTYDNSIQVTSDARSVSSSAGNQVDTAINQIDALLVGIDGIMDGQSLEFPMLYNQYKLDRLIDDNATGGGTPPDVVISIPAGAFMTVYTIPYSGSRTFRAKNKSADAIEWSLSTTSVSFSSPPKTLNANSVSNIESATFGPNGDMLLFHNTGVNAVDVEITIFE